MDKFSKAACDAGTFGKRLNSGSPKGVYKWNPVDALGYNYIHMYASVSWIPGCKTAVDDVDAKYPLEHAANLKPEERGRKCQDIVKDLWGKCK